MEAEKSMMIGLHVGLDRDVYDESPVLLTCHDVIQAPKASELRPHRVCARLSFPRELECDKERW